MNTMIFVRFQREGWHCWADAPEHRAYLRARHRHQFHVMVKTNVDHDDRDIEFHDLIDEAKQHFPGGDMGGKSCEMMARELGLALCARFGKAFIVEVSEDGEAGASVVVHP